MESNLNAALYRRLVVITGLLGLGFAVLAGRLLYLQAWPNPKLTQTAAMNHRQEILREPRRGEIRDVRNRVLASSKFVKTVCADPWVVGDHAARVAQVLSPILAIPEGTLVPLLEQRWRRDERGNVVTNRFVTLKFKVPVETWEKARLELALMKLQPSAAQLLQATNRAGTNAVAAALLAVRSRGVFAYPHDDQQREYAGKALAAHVIGYLDPRDGAPVRGIEFTMNEQLRGVRGWRTSQTDVRKRELMPRRAQDVPASDGNHVVLTIDATVQYEVEKALAEAMQLHTPISVSGLVVRPKTGEILAMATVPTLELDHPADFPVESHRNRTISSVSEPGSTFKIVVVAAALNEGLVTLRERFNCEMGAFHYGGRVLHDHDPYGMLSVEEIITKSSNIGAAKIGLLLGDQKLHEYIRAFGFGDRSNLMLDREEKGVVKALTNWTKISGAWIPMGHEVMTTQLQTTMAMCAIANGGKLMTPLIVDRVVDSQDNVVFRTRPQMLRQVVSAEAARLTVQALKTVVGTNGTAPKARLDLYSVAGKTGTAQKAGKYTVKDASGREVEKAGYIKGKYYSSFIGFFPADDPEICISIVLDEPKRGYYGGQTAAPVFRRIAERVGSYLNIRPDLAPQDTQLPGPGGTRVVAKRVN